MSGLVGSSSVLNQTLVSWRKVVALSRSTKNCFALRRLEVEDSLIFQKYPRTGKRSAIVKKSVLRTSKNKVLNHTGYSGRENPKNCVLEYPKNQIDREISPKNKVLNQTDLPWRRNPKDRTSTCTVKQTPAKRRLYRRYR